MVQKLKLGQIIYIEAKKYVVLGMIKFKEDTWVWQEYKIQDENNNIRWLSVEEDEFNNIEYCLFKDFNEKININDIGFFYNNESYSLCEKGYANVISYFGNVDVDMYEIERFYEYMTVDEEKVISIEIWDGETEQSYGEYINTYDVKITQDQGKELLNNNYEGNKTDPFIGILILISIIFYSPIISAISSLFTNKSMEKYMNKNTDKYSYVTSVTSNTSNEKAKVYKSKLFSIDSTVKDIINGVPEHIQKITKSKEEFDQEGIGLHTKKEYAYVYQEKGQTYIQVSNKKYVSESSNTYHSGHGGFYHNCYLAGIRHSTYSNYANSARQNSINSRLSSGGGTSFGK